MGGLILKKQIVFLSLIFLLIGVGLGVFWFVKKTPSVRLGLQNLLGRRSEFSKKSEDSKKVKVSKKPKQDF